MSILFKFLLILISLNGLSNCLKASDVLRTDSIKVVQVVNGFYDWYLMSVKEKKYSDFKPVFVEDKKGMTTLDFTKYVDNLKAYGFSDTLILKEKQSYSDCIENLEKIKYADFQHTVFKDLDEYEKTNCDFGNYYRWTGGQEPIDGIRIALVNFTTTNSVKVTINYFENDQEKNEKKYWGENCLTLIKVKDEWFVDEIDSMKFEDK